LKRVEQGEGIFESANLNALINDTECDNRVIDWREKSENSFKEIYQLTLDLFSKGDTDKDLKRALYFSLKQHMDQIADRHAQEVAPLFTDKWKLNAEIIIFQNSLMHHFRVFKEMVTREIQVENTVYSTSTGPQYRQCPKCNVIWFRIYGCDSIICGRRSISKDWNNHNFYNFTIQWLNKSLKWSKNESSTKPQIRFSDTELIGLSAAEQKFNDLRSIEQSPITPVGCGASLKWSEMKDVTPETTSKLKEFDFDLTSETDNILQKHKENVSSISGTESVAVASVASASSFIQNHSVEEVGDWLMTLGLGKYVNSFKTEDIDGATLLSLDDQQLKQNLKLTLGAINTIRKALKS